MRKTSAKHEVTIFNKEKNGIRYIFSRSNQKKDINKQNKIIIEPKHNIETDNSERAS
jgi:hypothetical protein